MHIQTIKIILATTFGVVILLACQSKSTGQLDVLALKHRDLACQLSRLEDSVETHWTSLNALLENHLPKDMPLEERRNMLAVKNAPLIRMFERYNNLTVEVKDAVDDAEQYDFQSALQVTQIRDEIKQLELQRMEIIGLIGGGDFETIKRARSRYADIVREPCNQKSY
ncbi:MAG: hypothetical protein IPL46_28505 [Saprospiraceae bacterium]|nr:hypothetical protein [Saprospiraceae bacterium]